MQAYCGWKQREDPLVSFRRSIGVLRGDERHSQRVTQGLQQALRDDLSRTVAAPAIGDEAPDRIRAFTTHLLDALGRPSPKLTSARSEDFGNAR